jgi:hypothetical protein
MAVLVSINDYLRIIKHSNVFSTVMRDKKKKNWVKVYQCGF